MKIVKISNNLRFIHYPLCSLLPTINFGEKAARDKQILRVTDARTRLHYSITV
jgi:hypothetical protein